MTSKMQSCVDHIKTSLDVDLWAMELVEHVFTEYDARFDKVLEIIDKHAGHGGNDDYCDGYDVACLDIKQAIMDLKGGEE